MRKIHIIGVALVALLAFSAVSVASASAVEWLNLKSEKLTKAENAKTPGTLELHNKKIPALEGGGEVTVTCKGSFIGTVGPGSADTVTEILGEKGESSPINCKVTASTNSICKNGTAVTVEPVNLPWTSKLKEVGTEVLDEATATSNPGYKVDCFVANTCTGLEESVFVKNLATGSEFNFMELNKATCSFGEGFISGKGEAEGFLVS